MHTPIRPYSGNLRPQASAGSSKCWFKQVLLLASKQHKQANQICICVHPLCFYSSRGIPSKRPAERQQQSDSKAKAKAKEQKSNSNAKAKRMQSNSKAGPKAQQSHSKVKAKQQRSSSEATAKQQRSNTKQQQSQKP